MLSLLTQFNFGGGVSPRVEPPTITVMSKSAEVRIVGASMFKNGYAFITREVDLNPSGDTELPALKGALGTIWFYSSPTNKIDRISTTMGQVESTSLLTDNNSLLAANEGQTLTFTLKDDDPLGFSVTGKLEKYIGDTAVLRVGTAQYLIKEDRISYISCPNGSLNFTHKSTYSVPSIHLKTTGGAGKIWFVSLEYGMAWAPGYALDIEDDSHLSVTAKATVFNNLDEVKDVTAKFISGFPNIPFASYPDAITLDMPTYMALIAGLDVDHPGRLPTPAMGQFGGQGGGGFASNSAGRMADMSMMMTGKPDAVGPAGAGEQVEDLYFYSQPSVSVGPGQRSMFTMFSGKCDYTRLFTADILDSDVFHEGEAQKPVDVWQTLRIKNGTGKPFTTAVATIFEKGELLGQGAIKFTAPGASYDLRVSKALSVRMDANEGETGRDRGFIKTKPKDRKDLPQDLYDRVTISGTVSVTNPKDKPITMRIRREFKGESDGRDGAEFTPLSKRLNDLNRAGRYEWTKTIAAGQTLTLKYSYKTLVKPQGD